MDTLANQYVSEGSVSTSVTVTLPWKSRSVTIINDSPSDMQFRFNTTYDWATLKASEQFTGDITTDQVLLSGNGAYRLWAYG